MYYWLTILFQRQGFKTFMYQPEVSTEHPFKRLDYWQRTSISWDDINLVNWKEITEEEYKLYLELYS